MKSEPSVFSIDDLQQRKVSLWDGVRNYQARNFMREMKVGDEAFFYHSSCPEPGIVGLITIARAAYPDPTQFEPENPYYDPKSPRDKPRWDGVDVRFAEKLSQMVLLAELKSTPALVNFPVVQRGSRLSVVPVSAAEWKTIQKMIKR